MKKGILVIGIILSTLVLTGCENVYDTDCTNAFGDGWVAVGNELIKSEGGTNSWAITCGNKSGELKRID